MVKSKLRKVIPGNPERFTAVKDSCPLFSDVRSGFDEAEPGKKHRPGLVVVIA
jgi:hypothetical protein